MSVTICDFVHSFWMLLVGSKLPPPQRFSAVFDKATATLEIHLAQLKLCIIKALRCSALKKLHRGPPKTRNLLSVSRFTDFMPTPERVLTESATAV